MPEDSVTVMLQPEDDTETILEKVRQAGAKKVSLIVPPETRALQTLGGFTMLRKACDITGIDVTVYSVDEKTRDMATVCRFEVVSLDQDVRPRPAALEEEPVPRIVVSTHPPEPAAVPAAAAAAERSGELGDRLEGLSADDLALFDALEEMSLDQDVELRPGTFRPEAAAVEVAEERPVRRAEPPPPKAPRKPSPLRFILDPLTTALGNVYIVVVSLVLRAASRLQKEAPAEAAEAPLRAERTAEEIQALQQQKRRYYLWALAGVIGFTIILLTIYALFQPTVVVSLLPREAETREVDLPLTVILADKVDPQSGISRAGDGTVSIQAQQVQVEMQGQAAIPASGVTTVPEDYSIGTVVFVNLTWYGASVPAGTKLAVSDGGITFHTTQDIWVPGSVFRGADAYLGKAQVTVVADTPGSAGNVAATAISVIEGNLSGVLTVSNPEPTGGGAERQIHIVMPEDQEQLRQQLVIGLREQAYAELQAQLGALQVLSGTLWIETVEETFSHEVGSPTAVLTLTARVRASALASLPGALDAAVRQAVEQQIPAQTGQTIGEFSAGSLQLVSPGQEASLYRTRVSVPILSTIDDSLRNEIRGKLRGQTWSEIDEIMQGYSDRIATYAISPAQKRLPSWGRLQVVDVSTIR